MSQQIDNLENAFKESIQTLRLLESLNYGCYATYSYSSKLYKKVIKSQLEHFNISFTIHISGFCQVDIEYVKQKPDSTDSLTIKQFLTRNINLETQIKDFEKTSLELGKLYN